MGSSTYGGGNGTTTTDYCIDIMANYVQNLTSSYANKSNETSIVATSSIMFILSSLFFILSLFSRVSDVSAVLNPTVRLFLSSSLSLFLPVMSYLFSEAKNNPGDMSSGSGGQQTELSLRARTILTWMLLVELLRKKIETVLVNTGAKGYSSTIEQASRIAWLGYLVFFNLKSSGQRVVFGFLWVIAASELFQRITINEVLKSSYAYGKNAPRLHSYMAHILLHRRDSDDVAGGGGAQLLKNCDYAVMGEEELEMEAGPPEGSSCCELNIQKINAAAAATATADVITVGKIWSLAEARDSPLQRDHRLKRLCLSFALHKLLRRRFENFRFTDAEVRSCRDLIFRGLCNDGTDKEAIAVALFQVLRDEMHFVCEYYHSVLPVVLSSPFFLLANYLMSPILLLAFFLLTFIACNNGDLFYAYRSIKNDNLVLKTGVIRMVRCLFHYIRRSPPALYTTVDLAITILLVLANIYEEIWEFIVCILSNWFMVSLIHLYARDPQRSRLSPTFKAIIRRIIWVRNLMSQPRLQFNQLSMLGGGFLPCRHPLLLQPKIVPKEVKKSIMEYLMNHIDDGHARPLSNGWSMLQANHPEYHSKLSWVCQNDNITEVMLTWHIATTVLEAKFPKQRGATASFQAHRTVATTLSKYCAYLVALKPELLPNNLDGTQRVYGALKKEMKATLGCWRYYFPREIVGRRATVDRLLRDESEGRLEGRTPLMCKGARAGRILFEKATLIDDEAPVWEVLAHIWTELVVFIAPSGEDEVLVKAHRDALGHDAVEFISVLWALTTHTGVTRPCVKPWALIPVENLP
uniref:DUF4220 domain-containing protein n=1 Tax=Oryza punctata TaxID=4537 RepID=A0A0E0L759_ORYPU